VRHDRPGTAERSVAARQSANRDRAHLRRLADLVPSGLCTAYFGLAMIGDSKYFLAVPMVDGPPIVVGAVLFLIGLRLRRR
jgi:hypothetical protein